MAEKSIYKNNNLPKSPSILILTDPQVDAEGRFGQGKRLGWLEQRSAIQDNLASDKGGGLDLRRERIVMAIPMSSNRALSQLKGQSVLPITPIREIKEIASRYSRQFGVPVAISVEMGNNNCADALAVMESGRIKIHLHPILQYRSKDYIEEAILREVGECRDFMREQAFGWQRGR